MTTELRSPRSRTYRTAVAVVAFLTRIVCRLRVTNLNAIPTDGGCLLVANHRSVADPPLVAVAARRAGRLPRFLAAAEVFSWPVVGTVLRRAGHIAVHRRTTAAGGALDGAQASLSRGDLVALFPEGGIVAPGPDLIGPLRTGAARLALATGVPVLPVAITGADRLLPPGRLVGKLAGLCRWTRVTITVGAPVDLSDLVGSRDPEDVREATRRIDVSMRTLLAT